jgi:L-arabinose isomerase
MRHVADTEGDKVEAQIRLGVAVNGYPVTTLAEAARAATDVAVDEVVAAYDDAYEVVPTLRAGGDRREELREAARIEVGLRGLLEAGGFGAFTDTFQDLGELRQLPGIAVQRLMADGYGFGAEGDWKSAVLVRLVKVMARGLPGGTSFMEDYTYHLDPAGPRVLGAHMLEVCPTLTGARPRCEIHPLSIGGKSDPVRLVFDAAAGPALVAGMTDVGGRFRIVANTIDVVAPNEALPRLPVARAVWQPRPDLRTAVEAWLTAGGAHHTVMTQAVGVETLTDFAEMAGIELLVIDETTDLATFRKELRWNQAWYHLARGL